MVATRNHSKMVRASSLQHQNVYIIRNLLTPTHVTPILHLDK